MLCVVHVAVSLYFCKTGPKWLGMDSMVEFELPDPSNNTAQWAQLKISCEVKHTSFHYIFFTHFQHASLVAYKESIILPVTFSKRCKAYYVLFIYLFSILLLLPCKAQKVFYSLGKCYLLRFGWPYDDRSRASHILLPFNLR